MQLLAVFGVLAAVSLLLHGVAEVLRRRHVSKRVALFAAGLCEFARTLALVGVTSCLLLIGLVLAVRAQGGDDRSSIVSALTTLRRWRERSLTSLSLIGMASLVLVLPALAIATWRGLRTPGKHRAPESAMPFRRALARVLVGRGLWAVLGRAQRGSYVLGVGLLVPALTAVVAPPVLARAIEERGIELEELYLTLDMTDAQNSWEDARAGLSEPVRPLSDEEERQVDAAARLFEIGHAVNISAGLRLPLEQWMQPGGARSAEAGDEGGARRPDGGGPGDGDGDGDGGARVPPPEPQGPGPDAPAPMADALDPDTAAAQRTLRAHVARSAVLELEQQRTANDVVRLRVEPDLRAAAPDGELIVTLAEHWSAQEPVSGLGRQVRARVRDIAAGMPAPQWAAVWERFRTFQAEMAAPLSRRELTGILISNATSAALDLGGPTKGYGETIVSALDAGSQRARSRAQVDGFLSAAAQGDPAGAVAAVGRVQPFSEAERGRLRTALATLPTEEALADALVATGSATAYRADPPGDVTALRAAAEALFAATDADSTVQAADAVADYADYFPGRTGDRARTTRSAILATTSAASSLSVEAEAMLVQSARSFERLRGSTRLGGVLIGRPADGDARAGYRADPAAKPTGGDAAQVDVVGLDWAVQDGRVTLSITQRDGSIVQLGPYDEDVVRLALAYAADGRPVTATMTTSALPELRVLLHPVLVDTALGSDLIEIDRWVDTYTQHLPEVGEDRAILQGGDALYQLLWLRKAQRVQGSADWLAAPPDATEALSQQMAAIERREATLVTIAADAIATGGLTDPSRSAIAANLDAYDGQLAAPLARCAAQGGDVEQVLACADAVHVLSLRAVVASTQAGGSTWSGVRELPFAPDAGLSFAQPSADGWGHVGFTVQFAFGTADELGNPFAPFELTDRLATIDAAIRSGTAADPAATAKLQTLRRVDEFIAAQRLFRLAFEGGLGPDLPVERLVDLAAATQGAVTPVPTLRFSAPGRIEGSLAAVLRSDDWMAARARACLGLIDEANARTGQPWNIDPDVWDHACLSDLSALDVTGAAELEAALREISWQRRLRSAAVAGLPESHRA